MFHATRDASEFGLSPSRLDTSIANLYAAEALERICSEGLQVHDANGFQKGHALECFYQFDRSRHITAGLDDVQKNQIRSEII